MSSHAAEQIQVPVSSSSGKRNRLARHEWKTSSLVGILACFIFPALFVMMYKAELNVARLRLQVFVDPAPSSTHKFGGFIDIQPGKGNADHEMKLKRMPMCDTSYERTNICRLAGDVRIEGKTSSVHYLDNVLDWSGSEGTWQIRPYANKNDMYALNSVRQMQILRRPAPTNATPECTDNHSIPAVIFSCDGYAGRIYHDFTDVLLPVFLTSHRYGREVRFLVTKTRAMWMQKYKVVFDQLTNYPIIYLDNDDDEVHCFKNVTVGLVKYNEFGVRSARATADGSPSMLDFAKLMRASFSLGRERVEKGIIVGRKARLLLIPRRGKRKFLNVEEVRKVVREVGFELVEMEPGMKKTPTKTFARVLNTCDVLLGVHGAGLTNIVFLPANATLIQIVPWGQGMKWLAWYTFGSVAGELGLKYLEYEAGRKESSLVEMYPSHRPIFGNNNSAAEGGSKPTRQTFLNQDIRVNVTKLRVVLSKALRSYKVLQTSG